jgi:hypothetical protein
MTVCLNFGNPEECQNCGGWVGAGEGDDRGPFEGDTRFCSLDCFVDHQEFVERDRLRHESNWCPRCGYDNWEHAADCPLLATLGLDT